MSVKTVRSKYIIILLLYYIYIKYFANKCYLCGLKQKILNIQGLSKLADQNNIVKSSSSGNNRKNILKNRFSLDFKIRTLLIDQSRVNIKLP
jgi:hypothetical protein